MDILATSHASLALVNLVFAIVALAVGFAAGAWVCGSAGDGGETSKAGGAPTHDQDQKRQIERDRTVLAGDRLRDLAHSVANDLSAHNESIGEIEADFEQARSNGPANEADVVKAFASIAVANENLQAKLDLAEAQIKDQAEQIRSHESEARTDALTSLANRRAFDDELKRRLSEWKRNGTPISLLLMDVDHFKKFNDTYGHQAGDEVLRRVGESLIECCRDMDLPCRYGGEEFAVIMPATECIDGGQLAERVRESIESMTVDFDQQKLRVTMSLGLTQAIEEDDLASVIKRADDALYSSKEAGRNNTHLHDGVTSTPIGTLPAAATAPGDASAQTPEEAPTVLLDSLPNRTRFLESLRQEVRVAQSNGKPLTLITSELEGHEILVNEFGPAVARLTLDSVAQFVDSALRDVDVLGRLGESQFVILMPETDGRAAGDMSARIAHALAECSIPLGDRTLNLVTRTGVTELGPDDTAKTLMRRAEASLLVAETSSSTLV